MQNSVFNEKDWKLYRRKIAGWQEAYMERLVKEYMDLLSGDTAASEKFWALEKRTRTDKKKAGVIVDMRRSQMISQIMELLDEGAIQLSDLDEFSEDLKERMKFFMGEWRE